MIQTKLNIVEIPSNQQKCLLYIRKSVSYKQKKKNGFAQG